MKKSLEIFKANKIENLHLVFGGSGILDNFGDERPIDDDDDDTGANAIGRPRGGGSGNSNSGSGSDMSGTLTDSITGL